MEIPQLEEGLNVVGVYPVVATTDNGYLENYSIGARVTATEVGTGYWSVSKVVVEGRSVSYRPIYGSDNGYSFSHGSQTYYFYM
tara:strand:- start:800 stop:1051 length:252 start_codon:yes stop_codon:yes gene_type:complete